MLGRALAGKRGAQRSAWSAPSATTSTPANATAPRAFRGSPTPRLRSPADYADYLRMATERSLERCGIDNFDLLLLHNPDRTGYTSDGGLGGDGGAARRGLTRMIGVAPGPANGFTLDLIDCFERFGELLDWAMIILNPLEPWPGELCLAAAADAEHQRDHTRRRLRRAVLRRRAPGPGVPAAGPPPLPPAGLDRGRTRADGVDVADRPAGRADDAPARVPVEPGAPSRALRGRRR